jgi:cell division protein FtsQ
VFYGPSDGVIEVASQYDAFNKVLKTANLEIVALALTPRRAWQITTNNGIVIELGRTDMQPRLEKFANVYNSTIAGLNKKITYADLRYPNGFAVRKPTESIKVPEVNPQGLALNAVKAEIKQVGAKKLNDTSNKQIRTVI